MSAARAEAGTRRHPAILIATLFGIGRLPYAPGTFGSLASLPVAWVIARTEGWAGLLVAAAVLFVVGWWAAAVAARTLGKDPGEVVIDEAAGQFLTLAAAPLGLGFYAAGFILFRLFDIWKPWPVGWADRRIPGGFGIMLDDVLAAAYAALVLLVARSLIGR